MSVYRKELRLRSKDVDMFRRLRTSTLFELLQEASIRHTEELGMGREKTLDRGLLWVLAQQSAEIRRMPVYDEELVLRSWPGATMHYFFPRFYALDTADGEPLVRASALWGLMSGEARKLVSPEPWGIVIEGETGEEAIPLPSAPRRLDCGGSRLFTVPYSYVDLNGHMNNTRYFDLMEDTLPDAAQGRALAAVSMEYAHEARLGETVELRWGQRDSEYYLTGQTDKTLFRMSLRYRDE